MVLVRCSIFGHETLLHMITIRDAMTHVWSSVRHVNSEQVWVMVFWGFCRWAGLWTFRKNKPLNHFHTAPLQDSDVVKTYRVSHACLTLCRIEVVVRRKNIWFAFEWLHFGSPRALHLCLTLRRIVRVINRMLVHTLSQAMLDSTVVRCCICC